MFQYSKKREKSKEHENPSSAEDFRVSPIKEKRIERFSTFDLFEQIRAVRNLQRARSAKFPAQDL